METKKEYVRFAVQTPLTFSEEGRTITGMIPYGIYGAAKYGFHHRLTQGCFSQSVNSDRDIFALFEHDWDKRLARTSKGTLKLTDTPDGLEIEFNVPDTTWGNDLLASYHAGNIDGFSFGGPDRGMLTANENLKTRQRDIVGFDLFEVSACFTPVFDEGAEIAVHSADVPEEKTEPESEKIPVPMNLYRAKQKHAVKTKL